ncbi:MAG: DUF4537 domain-containing protein [Myxococcales bacterium]|nr:DUF4537 domain-containing protein [Myxococcales bacterium]
MRKMVFVSLVVLLGLAAGYAVAAGALKVGDVVYAEWSANGWYHGKIDKSCQGGWHIAFDDGDQKCCTPAQIAKDVVPPAAQVKVGTKVLAQWSDQKYYPGTVSAIAGGDYSIHFDDGDNGKVKLAQIRLR